MSLVVVLLLITAACMMTIIVVSSSKNAKRKDDRLPGPTPRPGITPGREGGVRVNPVPDSGVRIPVTPGVNPEETPGGGMPQKQEDVDVLYQYYRESPVWVCSYCETENLLDHDRCSVCDHLNDRG